MPRANRYFLPGHVWHVTHRCHLSSIEEIRQKRSKWVEEEQRRERDPCWSESLAVGDGEFVAEIKESLGFKGRKRVIAKGDQMCVLQETEAKYVIFNLK